MNKELEALERIGKLKVEGLRAVPTKTTVKDYNDYYIVETALKDYENLKREHEFLREHYNELFHEYNYSCDKKLKALEIIKEKNVNCDLVRQTKNVREYNKTLGGLGVVGARHFNLTQEEFNLLKEVLL